MQLTENNNYTTDIPHTHGILIDNMRYYFLPNNNIIFNLLILNAYFLRMRNVGYYFDWIKIILNSISI